MDRHTILLLSLLIAAGWLFVLSGDGHGIDCGSHLEQLVDIDWTHLGGGSHGNTGMRADMGSCRAFFGDRTRAMFRLLGEVATGAGIGCAVHLVACAAPRASSRSVPPSRDLHSRVHDARARIARDSSMTDKTRGACS